MSWDDLDSQKKPGGGGNDFKPPDFKMPNFNFPKNNFPIALMVLVPFVIWFVMGGYYIVQPDEEGVVIRFGTLNRIEEPGLHLKFPPPFEKVFTPKVTEVKRQEIGFRIESLGPPTRYRDIPAESLMLTGDENIIDIDVVVQYKIRDSVDYLFEVVSSKRTLHKTAEAAIREVIGSHGIDEALTEGKYKIQEQIKLRLQNILDTYKSGLEITAVQMQDVHPPQQVVASFKDVASAREDKNRLINEAEGYRNALIPQARGEAAQIRKSAEGYRESKINHAQGDSERFLKLLFEYKKAKDVTKKRLYLETMEEVLPGIDKYIIPENGGTLPILSLGGKADILRKGAR